MGGAAHPMEGISSAALKQLETKKKLGIVHKRGSGVGLFASTKWKEKLLAVAGGSVVYFDSTAISAKNRAARVLSLTGAYVEQLDAATDKGRPKAVSHMFRIVAPARTMLFGCASQVELDAWLMSIRVEIKAAADAEM